MVIQMEECPLCGRTKHGPDQYETYCGRCEKVQMDVLTELKAELSGC